MVQLNDSLRIGMLAVLVSLLVGCETPWTSHSTPLAPTPSSQEWNQQSVRQAAAPGHSANYSPQYNRVNQIGQRILDGNPDLGARPVFYVPETPEPELFHDGEFRLFISQGLVDQCQTDGQLAAVLSAELARMAAERESRVYAFDSRGVVVGRSAPEGSEPPPEVRIGPDSGSLGDADQIRKAELAKLGYDRRTSAVTSVQSSDLSATARQLLVRAGYAEHELEAAAPLLREAGKNSTLRKQFVEGRRPQPAR